MTILSPQILETVIDLIESGANLTMTTAAIGAKSKNSKVIFGWIKKSEAAGEFDARPDPLSPWCIMRGELPPEWFHTLYHAAIANARATRAVRVPPIRAELQARLDARRAGRAANVAPSVAEQQAGPRLVIDHYTSAPVALNPPPPPKPRPSNVTPRIDGVHGDQGPPLEGRFSMSADRPKSKAERRAGTIEITDTGIRQW